MTVRPNTVSLKNLLQWPALMALLQVALALPAAAQQTEINPFGFEGFQMMLEAKGLKPKNGPPSETVLVIFGDMAAMPNRIHPDSSVLIATDRGNNFTSWRIQFERGPVAALVEQQGYGGYADCPLVDRFDSNHALFKNVRQLVCNRPGYFSFVSNWKQLAWLPENCTTEDGRLLHAPPLLIVHRSRRWIACADHSIFANETLLHGSNAVLAWNIVNWLCDRNQKYYYMLSDDGVSQGVAMGPPPGQRNDLPALDLDELPEVPQHTLLTFGDAFLTGLEDNDIFNQFVADQPRGIGVVKFRGIIAFALTALLAGAFVQWLFLSRTRPRATAAVQPIQSTWERRILQTQSRGHYSEPARMLAHGFFAELPPGAPDRWSEPPKVRWEGSHVRQWMLARQVDRLWRIAAGESRQRIDRTTMNRLLRRVQKLRQLIEAGKLQILSSAP